MATEGVQVFKVKDKRNGVVDLKEFNKVIDKRKVYDCGVLDELFGPKRVYRSDICQEIEVKDGRVDTEIDLCSDESLLRVDEEKFPFLHVGCIALGFMGLGRNMRGEFTVVVRDGRIKMGRNALCAFKFVCKERVSAFVDFPDFCVATIDLKSGFTLQLSITSTNLEFLDETHPLALNLVTVCRFMDGSLESKMLVRKYGKHMYQTLCDTEVLDPKIGKLVETKVHVDGTSEGDTMRDVLEAIRLHNERKSGKRGSDHTDERESTGGTGGPKV
uniref:Movement protein n=1 Tax=Blackberry virus A TaxID=2185086 RepID=A0A344X2Z9_9VIRU|nr:movement protein [Blackberry virus A]